MEPLWSPVVATGGNRSQMARRPKTGNQAKTVAVGCDRLPAGPDGKEGVDGSSPSEGFTKGQLMAFFLAGERCDLRCVGHRSVPKTCPHQRAVSWFLALTDASEAIEHLHEEVGPPRSREEQINERVPLAGASDRSGQPCMMR